MQLALRIEMPAALGALAAIGGPGAEQRSAAAFVKREAVPPARRGQRRAFPAVDGEAGFVLFGYSPPGSDKARLTEILGQDASVFLLSRDRV
jgi:hypothetical protein